MILITATAAAKVQAFLIERTRATRKHKQLESAQWQRADRSLQAAGIVPLRKRCVNGIRYGQQKVLFTAVHMTESTSPIGDKCIMFRCPDRSTVEHPLLTDYDVQFYNALVAEALKEGQS